MSNKNLMIRVTEAIDTVRPFLKGDGGDVEIIEITAENIVKVRLVGNCETCPMSFTTMKTGIEEAVKRSVPEIRQVIAINQVPANS